jgi:hypothetical protein
MELQVCVTCGQFIKSLEPTCPFCGAHHAPRLAAPPRRLPRVSRAAWLATTLASGLALGCSGAVTPVPGGGSGNPTGDFTHMDSDSGDDALAEEPGDTGADVPAVELDAWPPADVVVASDGGSDAPLDVVIAPVDAATDVVEDLGWHTCYGAPPRRVERAV